MGFIIKKYGVEVDLSREGHQACPRCVSKGRDRSGNNLMVYGLDSDEEHKGGFCFSCEYTIPSQKWLRENGQELEEEEEIVGREFNAEIHKKLKEITGTHPKNYRGIREDISKPLGVRYEYASDGSIFRTYYPVTKGYDIAGYKVREHPKEFAHPGPLGETGKECDLFGQFKYRNASGTILIVGGEHDQLAAVQLLKDNDPAGKYPEIAVVSGTCGETSLHRQLQSQYNFLNQFKKIILCLDNDKAGQEAMEKCVKVLPRNRVYVMTLDCKDPNQALEDGKKDHFMTQFFKSKLYTPAGVYASNMLFEAALECMDAQIITLPAFMRVAANMLGGGLVREEITVILAKTSIGKTLLVNEVTKHIIVEHPEDVLGILSLEATYKKYSRNLLSSYLHIPLHRKTPEEREAILLDNEQRIRAFYERPDGTPKFFVCDDRGASVESVKEKVLEMVVHYGVTILVIDPYSDLLSGMDVREQEELATWLKRIMKEYGITIIVISHVKKSANGNNEHITEDDTMGSSFLAKGAGITIALERDKAAEDPIERNTTNCFILKNREFSETGAAGNFYYDIKTATLHDKEQYFSNPANIGGDMKF